MDDSQRFLSKFAVTDNHWLWFGTMDRRGYGIFFLDGQRRSAHRLAYEVWVGSIPDEMTLDHLCRVRHCIRPDHLEPVTREENSRRAIAANGGNQHTNKTHCKHGHEFTEENTRMDGKVRRCRQCQKATALRYKQRQKDLALVQVRLAQHG